MVLKPAKVKLMHDGKLHAAIEESVYYVKLPGEYGYAHKAEALEETANGSC